MNTKCTRTCIVLASDPASLVAQNTDHWTDSSKATPNLCDSIICNVHTRASVKTTGATGTKHTISLIMKHVLMTFI